MTKEHSISIFGFDAIKIGDLTCADLLIICCAPEKISYIHKEIVDVIQSNVTISSFYNMIEQKPKVLPKIEYPRLELVSEMIDRYQYISFDIFDTVIDRKLLNPQDIFHWLQVEDCLGYENDYFESIRYEVATILGLVRSRKSKGVDLRDIYTELCKNPAFKKQSAQHLQQRELYLEGLVLTPNLRGISLCNKAIALGKNVSLISDTSFNNEDIYSFLSKLGITDRINLFTSTATGCQKEDGSIYKKYLEFFKVSPQKCMHCSDNYKNDHEIPNNLGFNTIYLPSNTNLFNYSPLGIIKKSHQNKYDHLATGLIKNRIFNKMIYENSRFDKSIYLDEPSDLGYAFFGPLLIGYLYLLLMRSLESKPKVKIFFCAREGFFLKKLFILLIEHCLIDKDLFDLIYLKTSRRVSLSCLIRNEDDLWMTIRINRFEGTLHYFLKSRFNIEGISKTRDIYLDSREDFTNFVSKVSPYIPLIIERTSLERESYCSYLHTIIGNKDRTILVSDLGTRGATQAKLQLLLPEYSHEIKGVYIAHNKTNPYNHRWVEGFLDANDSQFKHYSVLIESIFTANHGVYCYANPDQTFETGRMRTNQKHFLLRETVVQGISEFIKDFIAISGSPLNCKKGISSFYADKIMTSLVNGEVKIASPIRNQLYFDNELAREKEYMINL